MDVSGGHEWWWEVMMVGWCEVLGVDVRWWCWCTSYMPNWHK